MGEDKIFQKEMLSNSQSFVKSFCVLVKEKRKRGNVGEEKGKNVLLPQCPV